MLLADVSLGDLLWTTIAIFFMVIYFMILFSVLADLFRDHDTSGFVKFLWILSFIVFPFLGLFIYLIVRGGGMAKRQMEAQAKAQKDFNQYVQQVAGSSAGTPAEQITQAKQLLDSGTISQQEFDAIKAKALA
ncbi:MAG: SHOCT domain-containing protein [Microthrixaceae bacterium]